MNAIQQTRMKSAWMDFQVGDLCKSKYSRDGQFYTARIEANQNGQYLVNYIDYNETEWVPISSLKRNE